MNSAQHAQRAVLTIIIMRHRLRVCDNGFRRERNTPSSLLRNLQNLYYGHI